MEVACAVLLQMQGRVLLGLKPSDMLPVAQVALRWFCAKSLLCSEGLTRDLIDRIPGKQTDRKTPLGELNWIFTAITDTIAWNTLPQALFQKLFRQVTTSWSFRLRDYSKPQHSVEEAANSVASQHLHCYCCAECHISKLEANLRGLHLPDTCKEYIIQACLLRKILHWQHTLKGLHHPNRTCWWRPCSGTFCWQRGSCGLPTARLLAIPGCPPPTSTLCGRPGIWPPKCASSNCPRKASFSEQILCSPRAQKYKSDTAVKLICQSSLAISFQIAFRPDSLH